MKVGDLVRCFPNLAVHGDGNRAGVIVGRVVMHYPRETFWEVLYRDNKIDSFLESELEVINESR